ncbi:MAG: hypothetical protein INF89_06325 [Roseomonas sp.]|nr:hypothetical protein [Roseomonas sp.]
MAAPGATPRPILERLNAEVNRAPQNPEVAQRLISLGYQPRGGTIEEMVATIQRDRAKWKGVIEANNICAE